MQDAEDLMIELNKDEEAKSFYNSLNKSNKFAINFRLQTAKKPETRSKRMNEIIQMMKEKKKFH